MNDLLKICDTIEQLLSDYYSAMEGGIQKEISEDKLVDFLCHNAETLVKAVRELMAENVQLRSKIEIAGAIGRKLSGQDDA